MDKKALFDKVLAQLKENLSLLVNSAFEAKEASTNEESKAENKYDTRGLEASYLASGQAQRAKELQEKIYMAEKVEVKSFSSNTPIGVSALVEVLFNGEDRRWFFLLPVGGISVEFGDKDIQTISMESPIGKSLLNSKVGDDFDINNNEYEILQVH